MSLVINNNLMALNAARNLTNSYGQLSVSTRRLSSGLRINTAADDAAGLAIRELMRSDIASLAQGVRNANDAISMIQVADGALQVIDEKLIRMKELAEQAATGTYNSAQRMIIDSEYQAMASEITRIASSTKFNGVHLLNGNLSAQAHDGSGLTSLGKMKIHFGTGNSSAEDYYYIQIGSCTSEALGIGNNSDRVETRRVGVLLTEVEASIVSTAENQADIDNLIGDLAQTAYEQTFAGEFAQEYDILVRYYENTGVPTEEATTLAHTRATELAEAKAEWDQHQIAENLKQAFSRAYANQYAVDYANNIAEGFSPAEAQTLAENSALDTAKDVLTEEIENMRQGIPSHLPLKDTESAYEGEYSVAKMASESAYHTTYESIYNVLFDAEYQNQMSLYPRPSIADAVAAAHAAAHMPAYEVATRIKDAMSDNIESIFTDNYTPAYTTAYTAALAGGASEETAQQLGKEAGEQAGWVAIQEEMMNMSNGSSTNIPGDIIDDISVITLAEILTDVGIKADSFVNDNYMLFQMDSLSIEGTTITIQTETIQNEQFSVRSDAFSISTQEGAQRALEGINNAIIEKDKIRANLGAIQNRLENTITNLQIQAENLQVAESRISDADMALEMTQFVRNQILTQAATAMLAQANSLPQMALQLIQG